MNKLLIFLALLFTTTQFAKGQRYFTKNGNVSFYSKASLEDIKADNNQVMSVLNSQTGDIQFSVLIKSFHFQKALMEEHFNETYMESDKFSKATFKGAVVNLDEINFTKDGIYNIKVNGDINIHGVTKKMTSIGTITISGGKINAQSKFMVKLADFNVSIPKLVKDNIAETIEIAVNCNYIKKM
jgi:polyisoprenoid-binding protein YceI